MRSLEAFFKVNNKLLETKEVKVLHEMRFVVASGCNMLDGTTAALY